MQYGILVQLRRSQRQLERVVPLLIAEIPDLESSPWPPESQPLAIGSIDVAMHVRFLPWTGLVLTT
jgi:hypothetical protein